ncbi:MAG TPA: hypothetical protein VMR98_03455 [Candidatus Polarisedimenticolaceae bacterium]|nr:hypothetical protein [Candidatus Polarisedimenticolaceae bacterium]
MSFTLKGFAPTLVRATLALVITVIAGAATMAPAATAGTTMKVVVKSCDPLPCGFWRRAAPRVHSHKVGRYQLAESQVIYLRCRIKGDPVKGGPHDGSRWWGRVSVPSGGYAPWALLVPAEGQIPFSQLPLCMGAASAGTPGGPPG